MKICFFDTSAVVKFYHREKGSEVVEELFKKWKEIFISDLSIIEFCSAIAKKVRSAELSSNNFEIAIRGFINHVSKFFKVIELSQIHKNIACEFIREYGIKFNIRTLDALQLAVAFSLQQREYELKFVSSDKCILNIAKQINFDIINPEEGGD